MNSTPTLLTLAQQSGFDITENESFLLDSLPTYPKSLPFVFPKPNVVASYTPPTVESIADDAQLQQLSNNQRNDEVAQQTIGPESLSLELDDSLKDLLTSDIQESKNRRTTESTLDTAVDELNKTLNANATPSLRDAVTSSLNDSITLEIEKDILIESSIPNTVQSTSADNAFVEDDSFVLSPAETPITKKTPTYQSEDKEMQRSKKPWLMYGAVAGIIVTVAASISGGYMWWKNSHTPQNDSLSTAHSPQNAGDIPFDSAKIIHNSEQNSNQHSNLDADEKHSTDSGNDTLSAAHTSTTTVALSEHENHNVSQSNNNHGADKSHQATDKSHTPSKYTSTHSDGAHQSESQKQTAPTLNASNNVHGKSLDKNHQDKIANQNPTLKKHKPESSPLAHGITKRHAPTEKHSVDKVDNQQKQSSEPKPSLVKTSKTEHLNKESQEIVDKYARGYLIPKPVYTEKPPTTKSEYVVQVYSSPSRDDADDWVNRLKAKNVGNAYVSAQKVRGQTFYRVRFGTYSSRQEAEVAVTKHGLQSGWVDRIR